MARHLSASPILRSALFAFAASVAAGAFTPASAQRSIEYDVSFDNAIHHEARITATFRGVRAGAPLEAVMSRTSPGRYAFHDFAKNVYDVSAVNGAGRRLMLTRKTPFQWNAAGHDGTVKITYTIFADYADGTYAGIDSTHAHFNMPAAFMFAHGFETAPVRVTFHPRPGWKAATQLQATSSPFVFTAPHLQYFMDSPTELSDYRLREWKVGPDNRYTIRLALHTLAPDSLLDRYAAMARRVIDEEAAVWGTYTPYDDGVYTFLADYLPWVYGDGMEHRNSTIISAGQSMTAANINGLLGTLVHEHFHSWNMERLRDRAIEPFDFENADMSPNLWFGEGFTQYYTPLIPMRAGYMDLKSYARSVGGTINAVVNGPGRMHKSAIEMSQYAPFADAAVSNDVTNQQNTFISYYTFGSAIALGLDLTLRTRYDKTLDGFMRMMWSRFGSHQANYTPMKPYTTNDLRVTLGAFTGDTAFANMYFKRYIEGRDVVDYAPLLAKAGMLLRPAAPGRATLGAIAMSYDSTGANIGFPTLEGTAWYRAGIENGDKLIELDGAPLTSGAALQKVMAAHKPGETATLRYVQRGETKTTTITFQEENRLEVVLYEDAGRAVTPEMMRFRTAWTGTQVK
jgi:predicted metalloprotease with PDZ domain